MAAVRLVCERRISVVFSAVLIAKDQSIWGDLATAAALRVAVPPADAPWGEGGASCRTLIFTGVSRRSWFAKQPVGGRRERSGSRRRSKKCRCRSDVQDQHSPLSDSRYGPRLRFFPRNEGLECRREARTSEVPPMAAPAAVIADRRRHG